MIRSVDFVSQKTAEAVVSKPDLAIISITTPGAYEARLPKVRHILRSEFHDVEAGDEPWLWFERKHAVPIIEFVNSLHAATEPVDMLVHCKAGISRSSALALYIHAATQGQCAFPRRRFAGFANRTVLKVLGDVTGLEIPVPRALMRRETCKVQVLRDFDDVSTLVSVENTKTGEIEWKEGPIADEASLIAEAFEMVAGLKDPPPAHQVQDWDFSL